MLAPQDLPGRYGRVVKALDQVLQAIDCEAVVGDGWAVWRHGYVGRVTQDVDIILPADKIEEFLQASAVSRFQVLPVEHGRWPKVLHRKTDVRVDLLPQGERPGTAARPAPTTIPHPAALGAQGRTLCYISLAALIELKLAAGRVQDQADVIKLVQANPDQLESIRQHLVRAHADYAASFDRLVQQAAEEEEGR